MESKITQNNTKAVVPAIYYDMFALRILGATFEQIADRTNRSPDTVRHLFCAGGSLYQLYRDWVDNKKKENLVEVYDIILGNLPDIVRARAIHAKTLAKGSVESSKLLMGYALGDPSAAQTNIQINNVEISKEEEDLISNAFNNFGLIKEEKINVKSKSATNKKTSLRIVKKPVAKKKNR